jgi:thiol-disulfide isomerase/thioredoxin
MTRRPVLALLAVVALISSACDRPPDGAGTSTPSGTVAAANATTAPLLPRYADALPASDPERFRTLLDQLGGTPVLVNIWGSWCPPCEEEMPRLVAAHADFGDRVQFLGIDIRDNRPDARAFMEEFGMRFPSVFDVDDRIKTSLGHFGQPITLFYDRNGEFVTSWAGPISEERLRTNLRAIAS